MKVDFLKQIEKSSIGLSTFVNHNKMKQTLAKVDNPVAAFCCQGWQPLVPGTNKKAGIRKSPLWLLYFFHYNRKPRNPVYYSASLL